MANKLYTISEFGGIDQSREESLIDRGSTADACNMDTSDGALSVATGYSKHIAQPVPDAEEISHFYIFETTEHGVQTVVMAGRSIWAFRGGEWTKIYEYQTERIPTKFACTEAKIGDTDHLLIACGESGIVKYDGETAADFGSGENLSNVSAAYVTMFSGRLFAAGVPEHPNRLYYSRLPGGGRTIEEWTPVEASPNVEGGHVEVGNTSADRITALCAMSNQLLIFKERSLYRLIGDRPANYVLERIDADVERMNQNAFVHVRDMGFYMTDKGMFVFNGVTSAIAPDARRIRHILDGADASDSRGAATRTKLYFTLTKKGGERCIIEYDMQRGCYMQRCGFDVIHILSFRGELYMVNSARYIYKFDDSHSYDGAPIAAWWRTPQTDLSDKGCIKRLTELYLRGSSVDDAAVNIDVTVGGLSQSHRLLLPMTPQEVFELPLKNEGRTFCIRFSNENGGIFSIRGGVELELALNRRVE